MKKLTSFRDNYGYISVRFHGYEKNHVISQTTDCPWSPDSQRSIFAGHNSHDMDDATQARIDQWKNEPYDEDTRQWVRKMESENPEALYEAFYTELAFGTGGLRGIMGVGPNRMNLYTVGNATQGLADYLNSMEMEGSVAIAYDSRNNSPEFARHAAEILSANGFKVYLYSELRPTPLLSYTVRTLSCVAGIVITASHNPKEYNGYKVYWSDGGQLLPPHDKGIIEKVRAISSPEQVKRSFVEEHIMQVPAHVEDGYYEMVSEESRLPKEHPGKQSMSIVFTPLHGTGVTMIPKALDSTGFTQVHVLESQSEANGDFPTVRSPNPEEQDAMDAAIQKADEIHADMVLGTDPDTDRVGMGIRDSAGKMMLLNGNQAASLLIHFLLTRMKQEGKSLDKRFIAKTVVTTELLRDIATRFDLPCYDTLTGFKWIAGLIKSLEGKERFIAGGEESYGYLIGDSVRDKDAVLSSVLLCEMAAWAKEEYGSVLELLAQLYRTYGLYRESLTSLVKEGSKGAKEIAGIMDAYRNAPPKEIAGSIVVRIADYKTGEILEIGDGTKSSTDLPSSNVIQLWLEDGTKITARPSGTEPKIKYYVSVSEATTEETDIWSRWQVMGNRLTAIHQALGI